MFPIIDMNPYTFMNKIVAMNRLYMVFSFRIKKSVAQKPILI